MERVATPDLLVLIADFFMKIADIQWSIVSGVYENNLAVILRNASFHGGAGKTARKLFGRWKGSAGGHQNAARAEIPLGNILDDPEDLSGLALLVKKTLKGMKSSFCTESIALTVAEAGREDRAVNMRRVNKFIKPQRSDEDLARMVVSVAKVTQIAAIICITETGVLAQNLQRLSGRFRVIATTTNSETYDRLSKTGMEVLRLPLRTEDKYTQIRHAISVVLKSSSLSIGDLVICAIGHDVYVEGGNLIVLTDIEPSIEKLAVSDLLKLTDGIQPRVLEAAVMVACKIGRAARRGNRVEAIFMLGDSLKVLEGSKQLVPNPFQGHDKALRMLTNPGIHDALVELSKLDGAFVLRGDGFIQTAGVFLTSPATDTQLVSGLGTRHAAAAAVTRRTAATAIIISATDGQVRAFSGGKIVLQIDPEIARGHLSIDE